MVPAITAKEALDAPLKMETAPGRVSNGLPLERVSDTVLGEALLKVAVQVALWLLFKLGGAQVNVDRTGGATSVRLTVWVPPLAEAVMDAV